MRVGYVIPPTQLIWHTTDIHTDIIIYIYHAKSRLNTPVWGSLRSPNNNNNSNNDNSNNSNNNNSNKNNRSKSNKNNNINNEKH